MPITGFLSLAVVPLVFGLAALGGYFYFSVEADIRPLLPPPSREGLAIRFALPLYVWDAHVPNAIRKKYLIHLLIFSLISFIMSMWMLCLGLYIPGIYFCGLAIYIFGNAAFKYIKHRELFD